MSKKKVKAQTTEVQTEVQTTEVQVEVQTEAQEVKKVAPRGIGKFIVEMILETGGTNAEILKTTLEKFPDAKTSMACIAWYKSKLRREGKIPARVSKLIPVGDENPQLEA